ncbi:hypothetical protein GCM10023185_07350 [Hymenobacter saemangeumensis]|uniref:Tetratricopeptide repeat protein n=1 Tax=Hymenobacter saemangeumensis TaxID=1084522 RepID=A0ABP8I2K9_9BACT
MRQLYIPTSFAGLLLALLLPATLAAQTPEQQRQAANKLIEQDKVEEGMARLNVLLKAHPGFGEALADRGWYHYQLNHAEPALADLAAAEKALPTRDDLPFKRSLVLSQLQGDYTGALQAISQAIRLKPIGTYYCFRGQYFLEKGLADRALADEEKAIELRKDYDEAYLHKGHALFTLQRYAEALTAYEKAYQLRPALDDALISQGVVLERHLGQPEKALAIYRQAQKEFSGLVRPFTQEAGYWLSRQDWSQAQAAARKATAMAPRNAEAHNFLGLAAYKLKDYSTAEAGFRQAWQLNAYNASYCANLCGVLEDQKRFSEQLQATEQGLTKHPDDPALYFYRARALDMLNRPQEAEQARAKARELATAQGRGSEPGK